MEYAMVNVCPARKSTLVGTPVRFIGFDCPQVAGDIPKAEQQGSIPIQRFLPFQG
ncbi:MAG: hypothetical protein HOH05_14905 [Marinovum sp.]|nr:hypothetical protein [Marinovum sp.]